MTNSVIEPNTLWCRRIGSFTDVVYEVVSYRHSIVKYRVHRETTDYEYEDTFFLRDFKMLKADEVIAEKGGVF